ncbi:MAG: hypothetical protein RR527_01075 [Clostridia bacterium]
MNTTYKKEFFLGSNTRHGFFPLFGQLQSAGPDFKLFILKGGPGSGKSTLMKRVAARMEELGDELEYIPCASDPDSLDALIDHDAQLAIVDGTAPHVMDPRYPGVCETLLNAGDAWDETMLAADGAHIMELSMAISLCHSRATAYIAAAASLLESNRAVAENYVDRDMINTIVRNFFDGMQPTGTMGIERKRLLSAVSVGRTVFFSETLMAVCPRLFAIPDEYGAASHALLTCLRTVALALGQDVISCCCSVLGQDKLEHLLLPSIGVGFTTANSFHSIIGGAAAVIAAPMFQLPQAVDAAAMQQQLIMAKLLIAEAEKQVAKAKQLHDELEAFYIKAMDFSKIEPMFERIIAQAIERRER